jgi:7,8-dihydro-6-hydroxymethylpterin-pyrophosphokinase
MCVAVDTALSPDDLLARCKEVEARLGRPLPARRHGPRPIDVDVLLVGALEHSSERLRLPHPDLLVRRFVIEPLLELDAALELPDGTDLTRAREALLDQRVQRRGHLPAPPQG